MFHKDNKTEKFTPGFILVLHTFGRDLKWNPHIHCLLSEGGLGNSGLWRSKTHFNYTYLRNAFRTALLNLMEKKLVLAIAKEKRKILLSFNRWRDCTLSSFGYDPLMCPCCGKTMLFLELYHNHQHISLDEMYERAKQKYHSRAPA